MSGDPSAYPLAFRWENGKGQRKVPKKKANVAIKNPARAGFFGYAN
jgi:hypothetical protein